MDCRGQSCGGGRCRDRGQIAEYILEVVLMRFSDGNPCGCERQRRIEDDTQVLGAGTVHWVGDSGERSSLCGEQRYHDLCFAQALYLTCLLDVGVMR